MSNTITDIIRNQTYFMNRQEIIEGFNKHLHLVDAIYIGDEKVEVSEEMLRQGLLGQGPVVLRQNNTDVVFFRSLGNGYRYETHQV